MAWTFVKLQQQLMLVSKLSIPSLLFNFGIQYILILKFVFFSSCILNCCNIKCLVTSFVKRNGKCFFNVHKKNFNYYLIETHRLVNFIHLACIINLI